MVAGGRVSLSRLPPLLADAMLLARSGRRVLAPRGGVISASPSLGASAGAIDGAAVAAGGRTELWSFAGARSGSGEAIGAIGLGLTRGRERAFAAFGAVAAAREIPTPRGAGRFASVTLARRDGRRGQASLEALAGTTGRAFLADVTASAEAVSIEARWRYRSWADRRVAAELSAETLGSSDTRIRLSWRSWTAEAVTDDGILELEASARRRGAPIRLRLGAAGLRSRQDLGGTRELYGLIDATVAHEAGRSLSVHALRRASAAEGASASSATVGARLVVSGRWIGEHALLVESTCLRKGAPAWGIALHPSGDVTLRSRSRPGLWLSARGSTGGKDWSLGYALERAEDEKGPAPWGGSVWIRRTTE